MNIDAFIKNHLTVIGRAGDEVQAMCLFHDDGSKASMYVNTEKMLFFCHGCGAKGNVKKLQQMLGTGLITKTMDLQTVRERLRAIQHVQREEVRIYPEAWLAQFANPTDYWTSTRGLSEETVERFDLGYDPFTDAAIIPLRDSHGRIIGVIRRHMGDYQPRYLYPQGFRMSRFLYGSWLVRAGKEKTVAICEGSVDAMALWDAGIPAVALLGSRLSDQQERLLHEVGVTSVVLFTDNDRAGREAIAQVKDALQGMQVRVVLYPRRDAKDPADLTREERREAVEEAVPWHRVTSPSSA